MGDLDAMRLRSHTVVLLAVALAWQIYVVAAAFRHAAALQQLVAGMGSTLPVVTSSYFGSYRYWPAVPFLSFLLAADALRRERVSIAYSSLALGLAAAAGFALQAWATEAWFAPLQSVLSAIG
jgi:hypothetical protein